MISCDENCTCCQYADTDKCPFALAGDADQALDEVFLLQMEEDIVKAAEAAGEPAAKWKQWVSNSPQSQVQAIIGEGLQRHFSLLLRSPLLVNDGALKVGDGYQHLVAIAVHAMMLAAAVRHEVARVEDEHTLSRCGIAESMGGVS